MPAEQLRAAHLLHEHETAVALQPVPLLVVARQRVRLLPVVLDAVIVDCLLIEQMMMSGLSE